MPSRAADWAFDEGAGTIAADSSGNGHTATLGAGVSWVAGNVGSGAISVAGTSNGVVTATGPVVNTADSFTVSAWVDLASLSGYQTVVSIAGSNVAGFYLGLRADTGTFSFARLPSDADGTATVVASPTLPVTGTWYHLVGVDDASAGTLTLYVDGQSMGSTPYTGGWEANGNTLIGQGFYSGQPVDFVDGSIDDVELFSSALSAAQVVALDQPAAYSFDDGAGTTAADVSGHGNTLTLGSGASWAAGEIGSNSLAVNGSATGNATNPSPVINTALSFSVSAWVKLSSVNGYQTVVSIDGSTTSAFYLQLRGDTGEFAFTRVASDSDAAQAYHADATSAPVAGVWYNLIGVNDVATGQLMLYVNGVLQSTVSYSGGWEGTGATVVGGGMFDGARTDFVTGDIDDVRFYDSPLSAADAAFIGTAGSSTVDIATGATGATVSPNLFGAFLEDINDSTDGGIYNDEVQNSGFNDSTNALNAWGAVAGSGVKDALTSDTTTGPTSALTQSGKLTITSGVSASARAGISNAGYFGVAIAPSTSYSVMFYAKASAGFTGPLTVDLESTTGTVYATATISSITTSWAEYSVTLTTGVDTPTTSTNLFVISTNSTSANGATIWFGATYLYPPSYDGATNHLRVDLMQMLAALQPAIFRVPGGNFLEGDTDATSFDWLNTIGPVQDRPGHYNSAWGYWSTDGMGLDEYLQMAEEVGAQPILAVFAGYTLNGSSDTGTALANDVMNAVDELHYVLDPVTTAWGAERAANGHPAPYDVNYVEIGNEDFFSSTYATRYPLFYNAIHAAFPSLQIIATSTDTGGSPYNVLDEHFYETPQWFEANSDYFDDVTPGSYQIFIGEYASNQGSPTNDMESALGDASWLLGLERNSDVVTMSSYAPLLVNVNDYQWAPDLIGYNNTTVYGSPSYYAQVILSQNHGTTVVSDTVSGAGGLQTLVTKTGTTYYVTVINTLGVANTTTVNLSGVSNVSSTGTATSLVAAASTSTNSITDPTNIVPTTSTVYGLGASFDYTFAGYSITVLKFTADAAPTVATAAAATPSPVTGATANLSVLGADDAGESTLTYTWSATGPAAVNFSANHSNAAKNTTVTFDEAGTYNFLVTIANALGGTTTSAVSVTVIPAVFNLNDSGAGSLRQAIINANAAGGSQNISFATGLAGAINLASALPSLSANITIQGPGVSSLTISGTGSGSALTINAGVTAQIQNLTITGGAITNNGTLTAGGSTIIGQINGAGTLAVGSSGMPAMLKLAIGSGLSVQALLSISSGSTLDITNNGFIINYGGGGDPMSTIAGAIASGYNSGTWNGAGIMSSVAQLSSGSYGIGYADSADPGNPAGLSSNQIEITYTLYGDTNLDGAVNSVDFGTMAANFGKSGKTWDEGDFNYGGVVNSIDFGLLAGNFGKSSANVPAAQLLSVTLTPTASTTTSTNSTAPTASKSKPPVVSNPPPIAAKNPQSKFSAAASSFASLTTSPPDSIVTTPQRHGADAVFLSDR
ncbi:MAG TPA: LamG-like jellyroll fold domain-containing protein [Tepidisphaeraceae bacterium]|nr:LamG-like jellyroll fold domain-containing protein [Tepidisphaeraceae bacterium]